MYKAIGLSAVCMAFALVLMTESYAQSRTAPADESVDQRWARMEREMDEGRYVEIQARKCDLSTSMKSVAFDTPTVLRFKNVSAREVICYWINYEGKRDREWTVKAGEAQNVRTYLTHPFVVVDETGACLAIYWPEAKPGLVVIKVAHK